MDVEEFVGTVGGEEIRGYPTDDTPLESQNTFWDALESQNTFWDALESQNMFWDSAALSGLFGLC
jgi:hypothetical protein